ncbi:hypothetical protein EJ110_NYTH52025 [Nymphaea thermarum]|nr:hypothetical protein EJ110_NYTH52025 [Nymphaea thermarum]
MASLENQIMVEMSKELQVQRTADIAINSGDKGTIKTGRDRERRRRPCATGYRHCLHSPYPASPPPPPSPLHHWATVALLPLRHWSTVALLKEDQPLMLLHELHQCVILLNQGKEWAKCKHCGEQFTAHSSSDTSHLK